MVVVDDLTSGPRRFGFADEPSLTSYPGGEALGLSLSGTSLAAAPDSQTYIMPAFVNPPTILTLAPDQPQSISGLFVSDPMAAGLGQQETLRLTLSVTQGVLLMPDYSALDGLTANGIGTGNITLTLDASQLGEMNSVLASLEFAGPYVKGGQFLSYAFWNESGSLMRTSTCGQIYLNTVGTPPATSTYSQGEQTLITSAQTLSGTAQSVGGMVAALGGLSAPTGVTIAASGDLAVSAGTLSLAGTSYDDGLINAQALDLSGQLLAGGQVSLTGEMTLGASAWGDFADGMTVDTNQNGNFADGLSLAAGAILEGNGTLSVGNFSISGVIVGAGTIEALQGTTLTVNAGAVESGGNLDVAGGGVMALGAQPALFGIFNPTPLTIQSGVTLHFGEAGSAPITGGYADPLGGTGGAFVISGPQVFSGTVTGFAEGDALIFPSLKDLSVDNVNTIAGMESFVVSGLDSQNQTESYTIVANIPAGLMPAASFDVEGDPEIVLHSGLGTITSDVSLAATEGVAQKLLGIQLVLAAATTQALSITLAVEAGVITTGGQTAAEVITLSAANISTLNQELAALTYTGTGEPDILTITSSTGVLGGLDSLINIASDNATIVNGYSVTAVTEAQLVSYSANSGIYLDTMAQALGEVTIAGGTIAFESQLYAEGLSGTSMQVDDNGVAIWGSGAEVDMQGNVMIGDAQSAGKLEVLSQSASLAGNLSLAASSTMDVAGALRGFSSTLTLNGVSNDTGIVNVGGVTIAAGALFDVEQSGYLGADSLQNNGTLSLEATDTGFNNVLVSIYAGTGELDVGGGNTFYVGALAQLQGGATTIYSGGEIHALALDQTGGTINIGGTLDVQLSPPPTIIPPFTPTLGTDGALTLSNASLEGGTIDADWLDITGSLSGNGSIDTVYATQIDGVVTAQGGELALSSNDISGSGSLEIASGATLALLGADPFSTHEPQIGFEGNSAELILAEGEQGLTSITNMSSFDGIDLLNVSTSFVSISGDVVSVPSVYGEAAERFTITTAGSNLPALDVVSNGAGGSLIIFGNEIPCFARGSGILTPQGYRPVEDLCPGDPVITASGQRCVVRWVGWRTVDLAGGAQPDESPVIIRPHAFGPGKPFKPLKLSPLHCVYQDGILVPVKHLVNGATILQDKAALAVTYYHVELDRHDILLAEGLACESYFCNGNREGLYHELGQRTPAPAPYAPHVTSGIRLYRIRQALHEQALAAGFVPGYIPRLRAISAQGDQVARFVRGRHAQRAVFVFERPVRELTLICPTVAPAETDPASQDRRALGLCLADSSGLQLGAGWLPRADGDVGTWMAASAQLSCVRARRQISLPIAAIPQSWFRQS